tara:strand:+ start:1552 stop:1809 length:258 start_codon:yes stop_codon:yes gene_type:complete
LDDIKKLRLLVRVICEELGKQKVRMFKGLGATSPYYIRSGKKSLGEPSRYGIKKEEDSGDRKSRKDVTVSRAFIDEENLDIGNEV